jgi:hypothetical protein
MTPAFIFVTIGLGVVGLFLFLNQRTARRFAQSTRSDVVDALQEFISGPAHDLWDLFIHYPINDPYLESIRKSCIQVGKDFPPESPKQDFCNPKGIDVVQSLLNEVKNHV